MAKVKRVAGPPVRTAKVKLLGDLVMGPGLVGRAGEIYELPKHRTTELVSYGLAEYTTEGDPLEHDETPAGEKTGVVGDEFSTVTVETPTSRDPRPKRRG